MGTPVTTHTPDLDELRSRLFLTVPEAASLLRADPRTIRRAIEDGTIPAVRVSGSTIRIPTAPFLALAGIDPDSSEAPPASDAHASTSPATGSADANGTRDTGLPANVRRPITGL